MASGCCGNLRGHREGTWREGGGERIQSKDWRKEVENWGDGLKANLAVDLTLAPLSNLPRLWYPI